MAPTPSSFLDNLLYELEKFSALAMPADHAQPSFPEEIILEIKEEPSGPLVLPAASEPARTPGSPFAFPTWAETSAAASPCDAVSLQDTSKATPNESSDSKYVKRGFSDPKRLPEILGDKFVTTACTQVGALPITLPAIGEEEEEIWEGVMAGIHRGLPEAQEHATSVAEQLPSLHIEEEEEEKLNHLQNPVATPTGLRIPKEDNKATQTSNEVFSCHLITVELTSFTTIS